MSYSSKLDSKYFYLISNFGKMKVDNLLFFCNQSQVYHDLLVTVNMLKYEQILATV